MLGAVLRRVLHRRLHAVQSRSVRVSSAVPVLDDEHQLDHSPLRHQVGRITFDATARYRNPSEFQRRPRDAGAAPGANRRERAEHEEHRRNWPGRRQGRESGLGRRSTAADHGDGSPMNRLVVGWPF